MRLLVLLLGLFELDLIDTDSVLGVAEIGVDGELIACIDVLALRVLEQRPQLGASQGLQRPLDFFLRCPLLVVDCRP